LTKTRARLLEKVGELNHSQVGVVFEPSAELLMERAHQLHARLP
jgi:hypothetical protein